jgi:lipopolysaccharide-induced tumor necrosis factor-alpha factor
MSDSKPPGHAQQEEHKQPLIEDPNEAALKAEVDKLGKALDDLEILGNTPEVIECYKCHHKGLSVTEERLGPYNWLGCMCCVCYGCVLGCCLIPLFNKSLKRVNHHCEKCKTHLGSYGFNSKARTQGQH